MIHEAYGLNENIRQVAHRVTAPLGRSLDRALDRYGVPHEVKVYPGARHSFFNDLGKAHDPEAAADSWRRTLAFFERYLRSAT